MLQLPDCPILVDGLLSHDQISRFFKDQPTGARFLVSSDVTLFDDQFATRQQKRLGVGGYYKGIKLGCSIGKSPARLVTAQCNHLFSAMYTVVKLEKQRLAQILNHFAVKRRHIGHP